MNISIDCKNQSPIKYYSEKAEQHLCAQEDNVPVFKTSVIHLSISWRAIIS